VHEEEAYLVRFVELPPAALSLSASARVLFAGLDMLAEEASSADMLTGVMY